MAVSESQEGRSGGQTGSRNASRRCTFAAASNCKKSCKDGLSALQVIHSARANAAHDHGLDPERLLVDEAFVGKGVYLKRLSYHAKGRSGIMVRPKCRLKVVVREITPEEEAKIAKLRVSNFKKLTRRERQLVPHQLIETTPRWGRKLKEAMTA